MLGHRSVRMAVTNSEIPEMQIKAVLDAAADLIPFPATTPTTSCRSTSTRNSSSVIRSSPSIPPHMQSSRWSARSSKTPAPQNIRCSEVRNFHLRRTQWRCLHDRLPARNRPHRRLHEPRQGLSFHHQGRSVPGPESEKIGEVIGISP